MSDERIPEAESWEASHHLDTAFLPRMTLLHALRGFGEPQEDA